MTLLLSFFFCSGQRTPLGSLITNEFNLRLWRRDVRVWSSNPLEVFSCKSFFWLSLNPSPVSKLVLDALWKIEILKKVKFFTSQVLLGRVNTMDRLL